VLDVEEEDCLDVVVALETELDVFEVVEVLVLELELGGGGGGEEVVCGEVVGGV